MSSSVRERRGVSWKDQTLDSISAPPLPLMVFSGLLIMLLYLSSYSEYRGTVERTKVGFRFGLILLPLAVVLAVNLVALRHRMMQRTVEVMPPVYRETAVVAAEGWSSAAGLLLVLVMVLVMVYYRSSVQSGWFRFF